MIYAIIQSQARETRNEKSRTAKPDRTGGAANKSRIPNQTKSKQAKRREGITMKKTMLTYKTLDRFEREYKTEHYTPEQIETIEYAAYVANMNQCNNSEWTEADIFADFIRVLGVHKIETETAEADETETNEQPTESTETETTTNEEEKKMEVRHNEYADLPYTEFRKKFHHTLKRYPGIECTYNPHYAYEVTTTKYYKIGGKWHEKTEEKTVETVPGNYYMNMIDAIPFFRNLGGSERVQMGYTLAGYIPTQLSSISPDGKEKVIRKFKPVQI